MPTASIQKNLPIIGGIRIDTTALTGIAHECRPDACRHRGGCCGYYDVFIHQEELDGLIGMLPSAAAYAPHLRSGDGFANVFEEEDNHEFSIDKTDRGDCAFGYADARARTWCALHSAALDLDIPLIDAKPKACLLWPLALTETRPIVLSVHDGAFDFACNRPRPGTANDLDAGIATIVRDVFGQKFTHALGQILTQSG